MINLLSIQVLRGIAALLIVVYHSFYLLEQKAMLEFSSMAHRFIEFLQIGVDIFFIISGFIIYYTVYGKGRDVSVWSFIKKRLIRIVPLYWVVTSVLFFCLLLFPSYFSTQRESLFTNYILSLLFISHGSVAANSSPILAPGWTINFEMLFYSLFAGFLVISNSFSTTKVKYSITMLWLLFAMWGMVAIDNSYANLIILEFVFGIYLAKFFLKNGCLITPKIGLWAFAGSLICSFVSIYLLDSPTEIRFLSLGIPSLLFIVFALSLEGKEAFATSLFRWLKKTGDYSYSIYLWHIFICYLFLRLIPTPEQHVLMYLLATVSGSILIGFLSFHLIERTFTYIFKNYKDFPNYISDKVLLLPVLFLATLWDFRWNDMRIFDIAALGVLVILLGRYLVINRKLLISVREVALAVFIAIWCAYGYISLGHNSSLVIVFGLVIFVLSRGYLRSNSDLIYGAAMWVLSIHIGCFFIQYFNFHLTGVVINPFGWLGYDTRSINELALMPVLRASGLFAEPNSYCVNVIYLLAFIFFKKESKWLVFLSILTLCVSQSLWGVIVGFLLLMMWFFMHARSFLKGVVASTCYAVLLLFLFVTSLYVTEGRYHDTPHFIQRIQEIQQDPSLRERFVANSIPNNSSSSTFRKDSDGPLSRVLDDKHNHSFITKYDLFGYGISTKLFLLGVPLNGLALVFFGMGIIGIVILCAIVLPLYRFEPSLNIRQRYTWIVIFCILLTSYPLFTYIFFWIWLAATMPKLSEDKIFKRFAFQKPV